MDQRALHDVNESHMYYPDPTPDLESNNVNASQQSTPKRKSTRLFSSPDNLSPVRRINVSDEGTYYLDLSGTLKDSSTESSSSLESHTTEYPAVSMTYGITVKADYRMRHGIQLLGKTFERTRDKDLFRAT